MADDPPEVAPEYTDLEPVFFGSYVEAVTIRSTLDANGYETFIPNENMKVTDPFVTGANALDVQLLARAGEVEEIRALLDELRERGPERSGRRTPLRMGWLVVLSLTLGLGYAIWLIAQIL
jgi:hypothetical protein